MTTREHVARHSLVDELNLVTPPNWTAVGFLAVLSALHFSVAVPAFLHGRWEGYLSLIFATTFGGASLAVYFTRHRMSIHPGQRQISLRTGFRRLSYERHIPFDDVQAVRVTEGRPGNARVEVLCDSEDLECPPTSIPRQQALYLAIMMRVELIHVCGDGRASVSDRQL